MQNAIIIRLFGDEKSFIILDSQSRICNWLYNALLEQANALKEKFKETKDPGLAKIIYSAYGLRNLIPELKQTHCFLKSVYAAPLKNAALRLTSSIQAYQKSKKAERKGFSGWPHFQSWKRKWFSLFYDEPSKGFKVQGKKLILSLGTGTDRKRHALTFTLEETSPLIGKQLQNLRIIKKHNVYYAVFTVETSPLAKKVINHTIALDPNHKNIAYGVDTEGQAIEIAAPHWLKVYDKRIDEIKSKRDRCKKKSKQAPVLDDKGHPTGKEYYTPSKQWEKYDKALQKALHKRREQTKTFMYTLAHRLCCTYDCIAIGNYTPYGQGETTAMRRAMNNRSLIGQFKEVLQWTTMRSGKTFIEYDETGTTRTCHCCGYVIESGLSPSHRAWRCPKCETIHNRDENAAINGLRRVVQKGEVKASSVPSSGLVSVEERWAWCVLPSGVKITPRGIEQQVIATPGNEIESIAAFGRS